MPFIVRVKINGITYLSVYPHFYSLSEYKTHNLTVTTNIRNICFKDNIYITKAQYFDAHANPIHTFFNLPIFITPMEIWECVIDEVVDQAGDRGINILLNWIMKSIYIDFLEGIIIAANRTLVLSFTTEGKRIE